MAGKRRLRLQVAERHGRYCEDIPPLNNGPICGRVADAMPGNMCSRIEQLQLEAALQVQLHFGTLNKFALKLMPTVQLHLELSFEHLFNGARANYSGTYS
jgi:hypothetical protein